MGEALRVIWAAETSKKASEFKHANAASFLNFMVEVGHQHVTAYMDHKLANAGDWKNELNLLMKNKANTASKFDDAHNLLAVLQKVAAWVKAGNKATGSA